MAKAVTRIISAALLLGALALAGCAGSGSEGGGSPTDSQSSGVHAEAQEGEREELKSAGQKEEPPMRRSAATAMMAIGDAQFSIDLADNETAAAFAATLPMEAEMSELNGNEKYVYLDAALPASPASPGAIEAGDVMLYGDNCLVVFYEPHQTAYSYTRIGRVSDASGLAAAVGSESVSARFTLA